MKGQTSGATKKIYKKPEILTLKSRELQVHIQAAADSIGCDLLLR